MKAVLFVYVGDEAPLLSRSEELGYLEAILVYSAKESGKVTVSYKKKLQKETKLPLLFGIDCKTSKEAKIKGFDVYFQLGTINKDIFSGVTHLYNNEFEAEKDFIHQRRSGLNHVLLALCAQHKITIVLNFTGLQNSLLKKQAKLIGRFIQNNKLCRKKNLTLLAATLTSQKEELRGASDVAALQRVLQ